MMFERIGYIINPAAGVGRCRTRWGEIQPRFLRDDINARCLLTSRPGDAVHFAQDLAHECDVVVAVGGDGTICEAASGLLRSGVHQPCLGIVPLGTGNDAAALCGINDLAQAQLALRGTRTRTSDAIKVCCQANGRAVTGYGLLYGGVGLIGEAVKHTTPRVKRIFGRRLAYPLGALRAILHYRATPMRVTCDSQTWENRFLLVCASNGELSGGGIRLAPGARMNDGLLNVNLCEDVSRRTLVWLLWQICRGRQVSHPRLRYFTARNIAVETDRPMEVQADGELIGHTPANLEIIPQALRILIP